MINEMNKRVMIDNIEKTIVDLDNSWTKSIKQDITEIEESWKDQAREEYITKLENVDMIINKLIDELKHLETYWERYNDTKGTNQ